MAVVTGKGGPGRIFRLVLRQPVQGTVPWSPVTQSVRMPWRDWTRRLPRGGDLGRAVLQVIREPGW